MCDDADIANFRRLSRRRFGALGMAGLVAACAPTEMAKGDDRSMSVGIPTAAGTIDATLHLPAGEGPFPAVIMWPDVAGLRDAFTVKARRLAGAGFAVLLANPYYRDASGPIFDTFADWMTDAGKARTAPMREHLTAEAVMADGAALVAWLDEQAAVDTSRGIGAVGHCMSGAYPVYAAAAAPAGRVRAAVSLHGGGLVMEGDPLSPHALLSDTEASYMFAIAQNDDAKDPDAKVALRAAASAAGVTAAVEVYPADHGWTVLDSPAYDGPAAERAFGRMLSLYEAAL